MNANRACGDRWWLLVALADEFREDEPLPLKGAFVSEIDEIAIRGYTVDLRLSWPTVLP